MGDVRKLVIPRMRRQKWLSYVKTGYGRRKEASDTQKLGKMQIS